VSRNYFIGTINNIDYNIKLPISLLLSLNNLEVLESFKTVLLSYNFHDNLAKQIATYGDYSTMIWFQDNNFTMSESALIDVAKRGDARLFQKIINDFPGSRQILFREKYKLLFDSFTFAAENGHLDILQYAFSTGLLRTKDNVSFSVLKSASLYGHLYILKWFYPRIARFINKVNFVNDILLSSILGNHMHILEWILVTLIWAPQTEWDRTSNFGKKTMLVARASRHGNLSMVKLLIDKGFECRHTVVTRCSSCCCQWKS
jgi:hypothetical protein